VKRRDVLTFAAAVALTALPAAAQDYPKQPINLVIPFAAGGPTDTLGRLLAQSMTETFKQTVVVENRAGAAGTLAANHVAKAKPDGYTIFLHHIGHATSATLYRKLPFDTIGDFEPIGQVADVPMTMVATKNFPAKDLKELVEHVKKNKDKVSLGNAGIGAASHLCGMLFMTAIQTELTTVPYRGTGPAMNDLVGGQIDLMCDQTTNTTQQIAAGSIKVYGVTTKTRVKALPNVPTMDEAGMPGFEVAIWHGLYAPKGTPKPIIDQLAKALQVAVQDAKIKERLAELGSETVPVEKATPDNLRAHLKAEIDRWAPIIKAAGTYAD
jgi:tripartite-type tricarboxylate transporter receptor subunit TctC